MTLPSFVGIGGMRCGSTWLHSLLKQHPQIYVPVQRKELRFFDLYYDKGFQWYESFFPTEEAATAYKAIGEISPDYLTCPGCEQKIASVKSIQKLISILRNPVNRAYSHYGHMVRLINYRKSFEDFLEDYPSAITMGLYGKSLARYLDYFERTQLCCLIFENAVKNIDLSQKEIADFLEINAYEFLNHQTPEKINETYLPKFKKLNALSTRWRNRLRKSNLDWVINLVKKAGFQKVLQMGAAYLPTMSSATYSRLQDTIAADIETLEKLLNINLDLWRS